MARRVLAACGRDVALLALLWLCPCIVAGQAAASLAAPPAAACNSDGLARVALGGFAPRQRLCFFLGGLVTPTGLVEDALVAGYDQAWNSPSAWRRGASGYGKRFASDFAQSVTNNTGFAIASYALAEDPRWQPQPNIAASRWERLEKGLAAPFVIQRDLWTGPRFGCIAGAFSSGFVGDAWYPPSQRTLGNALYRSGTAMGGYEISSLYAAFQPELSGLLSRVLGRGNAKQAASRR